MKHFFLRGILYLSFFLIASSCFRKEDFDFSMMAKNQDVPYDLAIPLFETRLTIADLLKMFGKPENFVPEPNTGLVHLIYALPEPITYHFGSLVKLPNVSLQSFSIPNIPYWHKDTVLSYKDLDTTHFSIQGFSSDAEFTKAIFDTICISYSGTNTMGMASELKIDFANMYNSNGTPVSLSLMFESGAQPNGQILLKDVYVQLEGEQKKSPVIIYEISYKADLNTASNIYPDVKYGHFDLNPALKDMLFKRIDGYIGQKVLSFGGELDVPELSSWNVKDMQFYQGNIKIYSSFYGASVPFQIKESDIVAFYKKPSPGQSAIGMFEKDFILPYPGPDENPLEKESETSKDITSLLVQLPYKFQYGINGVLNGGTSTSTTRNVIERNSGLNMNITCDIPLWMKINDCVLDDTIPFSGISNASVLFNHFFIKGVLVNAFPLSLRVSVDFMNAENQVLFSIMDKDTVEAGKVGLSPDLHVVEPCIYRLDKELTAEEVALLEVAQSIRVWAVINTYNKKEAKIYAHQEKEGFLSVKMGARAFMKLGAVLPIK